MKKKIFFIGNRIGVLKEVYNADTQLDLVKVCAPEKSYLSAQLKEKRELLTEIRSKRQLVKIISQTDFDILISNGCPYILPVSKLIRGGQIYINIHPSLLPDLRGMNPINGAILFDKEAGATCHFMDDGIDTGKIISQINIGKVTNVGLPVAYQLCFKAESEVFKAAFKRNFIPLKNNRISKNNLIYYTRKEEDMIIRFNESPQFLIRKVKAFGIPTQCARFSYKNNVIKVLDADIIKNKFLSRVSQNFKNTETIFCYDDGVVFRYKNSIINFKLLLGQNVIIKKGELLNHG